MEMKIQLIAYKLKCMQGNFYIFFLPFIYEISMQCAVINPPDERANLSLSLIHEFIPYISFFFFFFLIRAIIKSRHQLIFSVGED